MRRETYTLVDDDGRVVDLVDDFLALCTDREQSPNTASRLLAHPADRVRAACRPQPGSAGRGETGDV